MHRTVRTGLGCAVVIGALLAGGPAHAQLLFFVTNTNDSGPGSLRQAVADANGQPGADGIEFSLDFSTPQTIVLQGGTLSITDSVEIRGPGPAKLTLLGNGSARMLAVGPGATVLLDGLTIANGRATSGGGIANAGTLTVSNLTITRNVATNDGGGISNTGVLTVVDSTISHNFSDDSAGGIFNRLGGVLTLQGSTLLGNVVTGGGGGGLATFGTATIVNSTVSGNLADNVPGGIATAGTVTIVNSTVVGNFPGGVGNIDGAVTSGNTVIAHSVGAPNCSGPISSAGHNISSDATCFDPVTVPSDKTNTDPKLTVLASNGGPTLTHAPASGSPAVNGGDNALVPPGVTTDQRGAGFPRIIDGTVDVGAVETPLAAQPGTGAVSVVAGGFRKNIITGRYVQLLALSNAGTTPVDGPISITLEGLTAGVTVHQPTGTTANGSPFKNADLGPDGLLTPGELVTVTLEFVNPLANSIAYRLGVLAGPGPR